MKITKEFNDDYCRVEISSGLFQCGSESHTKHDVTIGGVGETEKEAIKHLKKNLREFEANIIPEIKDKL